MDSEVRLYTVRGPVGPNEVQVVCGQYLVPEFAEQHYMALRERYPESALSLESAVVTAVDEQRVVVEGRSIGLLPSQELGMHAIQRKVVALRVGDLGELLGSVEIGGQAFEVVYHAFTLSWYLAEVQRAYFLEYRGAAEEYQQAIRPPDAL